MIFDWGGTLTPWHSIDAVTLWSAVCAPHFPAEEAAAMVAALHAAESVLWRASSAEHRSATLSGLFDLAGVSPTEAFLASYVDAWEPHTFTDPDVPALLGFLRDSDIKVGVLSNTMWPRSWHEDVFRRDGVLDLIDGAVYSSEIDWTKPHPEAFRAAMIAVGRGRPGTLRIRRRPALRGRARCAERRHASRPHRQQRRAALPGRRARRGRQQPGRSTAGD